MKNKNKLITITWKHVFIYVLIIWLLVSMIGGEKLKIGEFSVGIGGFNVQSKHIERETKGFDL